MPKDVYFVKCPRCGEEFDERTKECPKCGTWNRKVICRSCGAQINASEKKCPACGARRAKKRSPLAKVLIAAIPIAVIVVAAVLLIPKKAPADTPSSPQSASVSAPASNTTSTSAKAQPSQEAPTSKSKKTVEFTIPKDFVDDPATQEELDTTVNETDGILSATLNADGSVTFVVTEAYHEKAMQETKQSFEAAFEDMIGSGDFPAVTAIHASDDFTKFTVSLSTDTVGIEESALVLSLYMYGGMYNIFNGTPVDNVSVQFVNPSGVVIQEANSSDSQ